MIIYGNSSPLRRSSWRCLFQRICPESGPSPSGGSWSQCSPDWAQSRPWSSLTQRFWSRVGEFPELAWQLQRLMDICGGSSNRTFLLSSTFFHLGCSYSCNQIINAVFFLTQYCSNAAWLIVWKHRVLPTTRLTSFFYTCTVLLLCSLKTEETQNKCATKGPWSNSFTKRISIFLISKMNS